MTRQPSIIAQVEAAGVFRLPGGTGEPYEIRADYELSDLPAPTGPSRHALPWSGPTVRPVQVPEGEFFEVTMARPAGILRRFVRLVSGVPNQVLAFVHEYGPLALDQEGFPAAWLSKRSLAVPAEPVAWYAHYALLAAATLRLALQLRDMTEKGCSLYPQDVQRVRDHWHRCELELEEPRGQRSDLQLKVRVPSLWSEIAESKERLLRFPITTRGQQQDLRHLVSTPVNWWSETSDARHSMIWRAHGWRLAWDCRGAWGAIGRALGEAVTAITPGNLCAFCGASRTRRSYTSQGSVGRACTRKECVRRYERLRKQAQRHSQRT